MLDFWKAALDDANRAAISGCGQSDVLYFRRLRAAFEGIYDQAPEGIRGELRAKWLDAVRIPLSLSGKKSSRTGYVL